MRGGCEREGRGKRAGAGVLVARGMGRGQPRTSSDGGGGGLPGGGGGLPGGGGGLSTALEEIACRMRLCSSSGLSQPSPQAAAGASFASGAGGAGGAGTAALVDERRAPGTGASLATVICLHEHGLCNYEIGFMKIHRYFQKHE